MKKKIKKIIDALIITTYYPEEIEDLIEIQNGNVIDKETKNLFTGKIIQEYSPGIFRETSYRNGYSHGIDIEYYKNGKKRIEEYYIKGKTHGVYKKWYSDGKLETKAEYKKGLRHGKWIDFDESGQKTALFIYKKGVLILKKSKFWNVTGNIISPLKRKNKIKRIINNNEEWAV